MLALVGLRTLLLFAVLLFFGVLHHTSHPLPLQTFDMVSKLDKLKVCHNEALMGQEPETSSLGPRVSPDSSLSPQKGG